MSTSATAHPVDLPTAQPETSPAAAPLPSPGPGPGPGLVSGSERIVFRGVDRHAYNQLSEAPGAGRHVRLIYDGKDLEIVVTGYVQEILKDLIGKIVSALAMGRGIDHLGLGQTTWKTVVRGLEADLSYFFDPEKIRMAKAAWARRSKDPADCPRPDMAVEIEMSPPQVDRPGIYRELGVVEVWRFLPGDKLIIERLQPDGNYAAVEESGFLRVRADEVVRWLKEAATERPSVWQRRLNEWAMGLGGPGH